MMKVLYERMYHQSSPLVAQSSKMLPSVLIEKPIIDNNDKTLFEISNIISDASSSSVGLDLTV
jgi:hypothetical protein